MNNNYISDDAPVPEVNSDANTNPVPAFVNDWDNNPTNN